jgi:ABC-2 type transport system ATP-binding protein
MSDLAIKTVDLSKHFGKRRAVTNLNIEIKKGEIFSLLGTNGAGKTTTIKMLCCLLQSTSGEAYLNDLQISKNSEEIKKFIGVSPQESAIAEHLTSKENLLLMGGVFGLSRKESQERAKNLMDLLEIEDRKDQTRKLSGGLQRRLSIAMALMSDPEILFLDEPTLGLDPHARKSVWNYIEKLKKHKTILLTTHYLEEADALADHIAIMESGNIIASGTSSSLKELSTKPKSLLIKGSQISDSILPLLNELELFSNLENNILTIEGSHFDVYKIMEILKNQNVEIKSIQMSEPTLDDVFIQLTGKERVL